MKKYKIHMDMTLVLGELVKKKIKLGKFNSKDPIIFTEANNPDGACFNVHTKLSDLILSQQPENTMRESVEYVQDVMNDVRVTRIELVGWADE